MCHFEMKLTHTDVHVHMYSRSDVLWRSSVKFVAVVQRWGTDSSEEEEGMNPILSLNHCALWPQLSSTCVCACACMCTPGKVKHFVNEFLQLCHHRVSCQCRYKADWTSLFEPGSSSFCLICLQQVCMLCYVFCFVLFFHSIQQSVTLHTSCQLIGEKGTTVLGTRLH